MVDEQDVTGILHSIQSAQHPRDQVNMCRFSETAEPVESQELPLADVHVLSARVPPPPPSPPSLLRGSLLLGAASPSSRFFIYS